jgi:hypothetical protein
MNSCSVAFSPKFVSSPSNKLIFRAGSFLLRADLHEVGLWRRVMPAHALVPDPGVLLDEPTNHLEILLFVSHGHGFSAT